MKKNLFQWSFFVLFGAGLVGFASCTNEDENSVTPDEKGLIPVEIRGSIGGDSRTKLSDSDSKTVEFQSGDSLAVWDGQGDQEIRRFGTDGSGNVAIFKGNLDPNALDLNILYPLQDGATCTGTTITATIPATQTATAGTFDPKANLAAATADYTKGQNITCTLQNVCGLLKFTVDQAYDKAVICGALGEKIAGKVTIDASTGAVTATAESADLIILEDGLTPGNTYCVAMIPQEYKDGISIKLYGSDGKLAGRKRILKSSGAVTVKPSVILSLGEVAPESTEPLTGEFSVGTGKVKFSKGNLHAIWNGTGYDWTFAERQWDAIRDTPGNTTIDNQKAYSIVDLFGWSTVAANNNRGIHTKTSPSAGWTDGNFNDWGSLMGSDWRTLTSAEWTNLCNRDKAWAKATINTDATGVAGLLLFPDGFSWSNITWSGTPGPEPAYKVTGAAFNANTYTSVQFADMEKAGVVLLPCAGYRNGSTVNGVGDYVAYWSSTPGDSTDAYYLLVRSSGTVSSDVRTIRHGGLSVRLVYSIE